MTDDQRSNLLRDPNSLELTAQVRLGCLPCTEETEGPFGPGLPTWEEALRRQIRSTLRAR